jgi:hypothetical protein
MRGDRVAVLAPACKGRGGARTARLARPGDRAAALTGRRAGGYKVTMKLLPRWIARACAAALALATFFSCAQGEKPSVAIKREQLFSLGYGETEDQIDLFQVEGDEASQKTRIAMREGIFYIANGAGYKVSRLSSFGSLLSMIYNAERNPEPVVLKRSAPGAADAVAADAAARKAVPYPFRAIGEIAVASDQTIYVEDRLPPERRAQEKESGALLDRVVLRFGKDGKYMDYLGQEGIGGTPFPYVVGVYAVASDDCVVVSMTQSAWLAYWFDAKGLLAGSARLARDGLPLPDKGEGLIASLDKIVPDNDGRYLLFKVDYYKESIDPSTKTSSGIEFANSWVYRMSLRDGSYSDRWLIPAVEATVKDGPDGKPIRYARVPEFLGAAGNALFFMLADDEGKTSVSTFDRTTRAVTRYGIDISSDELYFNSYFLSRDGILCALLGTKYEARVVWWRFDKIIGGIGQGLAK